MIRHASILIGLTVLFSACFSGCSIGDLSQARETATPIPQPTVTITPTVEAQTELVICLGDEPDSLYIYAQEQSDAMWSILEAIYDGPYDRLNGGYSAVILQKIPTYEDGDLIRSAVSVSAGDLVVDANNQIVALAKGRQILPAGCNDVSCALTWDGTTELQMDQVTATYTLRANLQWSDGMILTAADSKFSFEVNNNPASRSGGEKLELTQSYEVIDAAAVQWKGIPGYVGIGSQAMFWSPLPRHLLESVPVSELAGTELAAKRPIGWGPYVISEWIGGESISMQKNPLYYRADEGLPGIDRIVYRFIDPDSGGGLAALAAGQCDLVERSSDPEMDLGLVADLLNSTNSMAMWSGAPEITQLVIGIKPSDYDDGYNAAYDRPDYFKDAKTRQALAACIDREKINNDLFFGRAALASIDDLLGNQIGSPGGVSPIFDRLAAGELLEKVGWMDSDDDPMTPRLAMNVAGIPTGTPLSIELLSPADTRSLAIASGIASSLADCGIQASTASLPFAALYAPGPDGLIFGRSFDLALINWQYSVIPACYLYMSMQIPTSTNHWLGGNVTGYNRAEFDLVCSGLQRAMPGDGDYERFYQKAVEYFQMDMPAIPLFRQPRLMLSRQDMCNLTFNVFARSDLAGLELFDFSPSCESK
jgi:peptide/nickel transport system substrate-binding protein